MNVSSGTEIYSKVLPSAARLRKQDLRMGGKSSEVRRKASTGSNALQYTLAIRSASVGPLNGQQVTPDHVQLK